MKPSSYSYSFCLPGDRETVFELFAAPQYLDHLTPSWFRLQPLGEIPRILGAGTEISYRLRWRGLPLRWTSLLTDWQAPEYFAYEQRQGPYRFFRHEHFFESVHDGTKIRDRVFFRAPGGLLADQLFAKPDLRRIFSFREQRALLLIEALQLEGRSEPPSFTGPESTPLTPPSSQPGSETLWEWPFTNRIPTARIDESKPRGSARA